MFAFLVAGMPMWMFPETNKTYHKLADYFPQAFHKQLQDGTWFPSSACTFTQERERVLAGNIQLVHILLLSNLDFCLILIIHCESNQVEIYDDSRKMFYMALMWASQGNTPPAAFWTLAYLIHNPEAFQTCAEEVKTVLGSQQDNSLSLVS